MNTYEDVETPEFMVSFEWFRSSSGYTVSSIPIIAAHDFNQNIGLVERAMIYQKDIALKTAPFIFPNAPHPFDSSIKVPQDILFPHPSSVIIDNQILPSLAMAQSSPTIDSLLSFTNQFGLLTGGLLLTINENPYLGDSIHLWFQNRWIIKNLLTLWEWILKKDIANLKKIFIRRDLGCDVKNIYQIIMTDESILNELHSHNGVHLEKQTDLQLQISLLNNISINQLFLEHPHFVQDPSFSDNEIINTAYHYLMRQLKSRLEYFPTQFEVVYNPKETKLEQGFKTDTLLGLIWHQFFHYVTGERKLKRCPICGQWQDVTGRKSSWNAHKLCSGKERKRKWRDSKKPAKNPRGRPKKHVNKGGFEKCLEQLKNAEKLPIA